MGSLELENVRKSFGDVVAVDGVSLDIADGEFFVILGPSGAGKTTTLKSIAGLVEIDEGRVHVAGVDMSGVEPYHRNVAMAFESYALYPQKTVAQNLASPLRSGRTGRYSQADQRERIEHVTTMLGINHLLDRLPKELSNGQRQRTALGRVLVRPADVYLLDEPLSHLDAKLRASMRSELKAIAQTSSTTTVYVTHDYQEAVALGDRVAVLRDGEIVQVGSPEDVWRAPADTFVARSLGQPEMNLVDGEVQDGQVTFLGGAASFPNPPELGLAPGEGVTVGLRPGEIQLPRERTADSEWLRIPGSVVLAERLGRQVELEVAVGNERLILVEDSDQAPREGDHVQLQIHLPNVHLFQPRDERREARRLGSATGLGAAAPAEEARR